jgi:phage gpG-like protein
MDFKQFTDKTLKDIEIKATELFDRNFEQQGFFGAKWKPRKNDSDPGRAILIGRGSGRLRKGIQATKRSNNTITWQFDVPYAKIHNEGGTIKATQNVRPFSRTIKGKVQKVKSFSRKVNTKIPQRQFIGNHPLLRVAIQTIVDRNIKKFNDELLKNSRK